MRLAWHEDCQDNEYREPHLIDEQESQKDEEIDVRTVCVVDECKDKRGTDGQGKCGHSTHSKEDL